MLPQARNCFGIAKTQVIARAGLAIVFVPSGYYCFKEYVAGVFCIEAQYKLSAPTANIHALHAPCVDPLLDSDYKRPFCSKH